MDFLKIIIIVMSVFIFGCSEPKQKLPLITEQDQQKADEIQKDIQEQLIESDALNLDSLNSLKQKSLSTKGIGSRLLAWANRKAVPRYLRSFDKNHPMLDKELDSFVEYKGILGRCYQFRLFYKYEDSRVEGVRWASSILTIPSKAKKGTQAGVVLAPTLDGFESLLETGLWMKLCRKKVASLMPESLYTKQEDQWQKLHFDPTPDFVYVEEYDLYEKSIKRYENILNKNVELLRSFESLKTDQGEWLSKLNVMPLKSNKIGFWGSSFGAVVGSLVVAKDPKIKAAVLSVGGGNLPYIISRSNIALFKKTRKEQMKLLGLKSVDEYQRYISQFIDSDPLRYAKAEDSNRLYMILAKKDRSVPTVSQYQLLEAFGNPKRAKIYTGHVGALLYMSWFSGYASRRALRNLVRKLEAQ